MICLNCGKRVTKLGVLVRDVTGKAYRMHGPCPRLYRQLWAAGYRVGPELVPDIIPVPPKHVAVEFK